MDIWGKSIPGRGQAYVLNGLGRSRRLVWLGMSERGLGRIRWGGYIIWANVLEIITHFKRIILASECARMEAVIRLFQFELTVQTRVLGTGMVRIVRFWCILKDVIADGLNVVLKRR